VADPDGGCDAFGGHGLADVGDVLTEAPGRLPAGSAMASEVRCDHTKPSGERVGDLAAARSLAPDSVEEDERWTVRRAEAVEVQPHSLGSK
jgi:hypothetical protein